MILGEMGSVGTFVTLSQLVQQFDTAPPLGLHGVLWCNLFILQCKKSWNVLRRLTWCQVALFFYCPPY